MGHDHNQHNSGKNLGIAFALNLGFAVLEIIGGLLTNSIAILSDALHDLGDSLSLGLAWFLSRYSSKESNQKYSYGYRRYSLLGALINSLVLIVGSFVILTEAVPRLFDPESFNAQGMIVFALLGIVVNGAAAFQLRGDRSHNAQVVGWHLLEDVLGWIAVLIVGLVSLFIDVPVLDPLLSIFVTLFVLYNVFRKLMQTADLFLQAVPPAIDLESIKVELLKLEYVNDLHHVHIWSLDGEANVFTAHLIVDDKANRPQIVEVKHQVEHILSEIGFRHVTIEIEFGEDDCSVKAQAHEHEDRHREPSS